MQTSFLRWAGSKKKLLSKLLPYWNAANCKRYVEPFAGSAMLYFSAKPSRALLADTNGELINMYCAVKRDWESVLFELRKWKSDEKTYYKIRDAEDLKDWGVFKRAARFIYLNRFCFNGLYRTNAKGKFNVPFALETTRKLPTKKEMREFAAEISKASFKKQDFRKTLGQVKEGDFVYIDPPYAVENKRIFRQYGPATFGVDDLCDLANLLVELDGKGVKFVVSYAYNKIALDTLGAWFQKSSVVQRTVASDVSCRKHAKELFVSNIRI